MAERTIHIGRRDDPETSEVTLYIKEEPCGPIVTGTTFEEAKAKFLQCLPAAMVANSYCEFERNPSNVNVWTMCGLHVNFDGLR